MCDVRLGRGWYIVLGLCCWLAPGFSGAAPTTRALVSKKQAAPTTRATAPTRQAVPGARATAPTRQAVSPTSRKALAPQEQSIVFLLDKCKRHAWRARYDAAQALARLAATQGWKAFGTHAVKVEQVLLHALLQDRNFWVRAGAAKALGEIGDRGVLALVAALRKDPQSEVRNAAIRALAAIGRRGHKPLLGGHLQAVLKGLRKARKDKAIRWTAARAWESLTGDAQPMVEVIMHDLQHRNATIQGMVARSFGKLSMRAKTLAVPALLKALAHWPASTHEYIVTALQSIGQLAIPALRQSKRHPNIAVRQAAAKALAGIEQRGQ